MKILSKKKKNPLPPTQQNIRRWIYANIHKYYPDLDRFEFVDVVKSHFGPLASDSEITEYRSLYNQIYLDKKLSDAEKKYWWRYWMIENPIDFPKYDNSVWKMILETMGDKTQNYLSDIKRKAQRKLERRQNPFIITPENLRRWIYLKSKNENFKNKSIVGLYDDLIFTYDNSVGNYSFRTRGDFINSDIRKAIEWYKNLYKLIFLYSVLATKKQKENMWRHYMIEEPITFDGDDNSNIGKFRPIWRNLSIK